MLHRTRRATKSIPLTQGKQRSLHRRKARSILSFFYKRTDTVPVRIHSKSHPWEVQAHLRHFPVKEEKEPSLCLFEQGEFEIDANFSTQSQDWGHQAKEATIPARDKAPEKRSKESIYHLRFPVRPQIPFRNLIFCEKKVTLKDLSMLEQATFHSHCLPTAKNSGMTGRRWFCPYTLEPPSLRTDVSFQLF